MSGTSGTSGGMSSGTLPDSIFTWVFEAFSGDQWGGWLVEDSQTYAVGSILATAHGTYRIVAEEERGTDLAGAGLNEGAIAVAWYRDAATAAFLVTRNGAGSAVGSNGLGSEIDAAWSGTDWVEFGRGGAAQVDGAGLPDSLFTWIFTAASGDLVYGTLLADSDGYAVGDTLRTAHGVYRILTETVQSGSSAATGLVHVTRYHDAQSRRDLTLESGGTQPAGTAGLGSELDRAWDGVAWRPVGQGGAWQADSTVSLYSFTFHATSGDHYVGRLVDAGVAYAAGDTIAGTAGHYRIDSETQLTSAQPWALGSLWIDLYYDAGSGLTVLPHQTHVAARPNVNLGLGNEVDKVWDGDNFDQIGRGGALQADVEQFSLFRFTFQANSGDRYTGWYFTRATLYDVGDTIAGAQGHYRIDEEIRYGFAEVVPDGSVRLDTYYDAVSALTGYSYNTHVLGRNNANLGLGNEVDQVWDGRRYEQYGRGGTLQADVEGYAIFVFTFHATSGDRYTGWLYEDLARYSAGDTIAGAQGYYRIDEERFHGVDLAAPLGSMWLLDYYDADSNLTGRSHTTYVVGGANSGRGLGNEIDQVWDGDRLDQYGRGGTLQANVEGYAIFVFTFHANSGDRYTGWLYEDLARYSAGDTIAGAQGYYRIDEERFHGVDLAAPRGSMWLLDYYDADSNLTGRSHTTYVVGGANSGRGLGNEIDQVWDGDRFDQYGRGGALQATVEGYTIFVFTFHADSGDRYTGWLYENLTLYSAGDTIAGARGYYEIDEERFHGVEQVAPLGSMWLLEYYDSVSGLTGRSHTTYTLGQVNPGRGLGNEIDQVWDGDNFDLYGRGGLVEANVEGYAIFVFTFLATSGDRYTGWVYENVATYAVGDTITGAQGRYHIDEERFHGVQLAAPLGSIWLMDYVDGQSSLTGRSYTTFTLGQVNPGRGLGNEIDQLWDGDGYDQYGRGGTLQVDVEPFL